MKKYFVFTIVFFACFNLLAQEKGKIRVGGNLGLAMPNDGVGLTMDLLDVRYNIQDNLNIGIKFGGAFMVRDAAEIDFNTAKFTTHFNSNTMLVGDYYFNKGRNSFAPFIGGSIGIFRVLDIYFEGDTNTQANYVYEQIPGFNVNIGSAIRTGFELGKFRVAMEYYIIPETNLFDAKNIMSSVGMSENNYLSINFGFYFGGGKWRKMKNYSY